MPILARKRFRFHGLKRPKIRQDMKKETLYNLARLTSPNMASRTYFQQKWSAKSLTRAYHGEQMKEKSWIHIQSRTAPAVVPMDPRYLARNDGSEQAAGRGSGLTPSPETRIRVPEPTPYTQMLYHPTERRLDTAIYRALFASSARQARQMVTHGHVKVNGKSMRYPGYMLNPGDMFQVDPERVMWSMGAKKPKNTLQSVIEGQKAADQEAESLQDAVKSSPPASQASAQVDAVEEAYEEEPLEEEEAISENDPLGGAKRTLRELRSKVRTTLDEQKQTLSGKRLRELRALSKELRSSLSKVASVTPSQLEDLETQVLGVLSSPDSATPSPPPSQQTAAQTTPLQDKSISDELQAAIDEARENPYDPSKPYLTPWRPRDFMSAFAFVPRYLEVNHNVCAAVYLRHPVCYPGFAEVPTPFSPETGILAFNWYLRRR